LTVFDDGHAPALIAAGRFATSGGVAVDNIARWDGANWSSVGGGMIGASAWIYALTSFDDGHGARLFAGGTFDSAGGVAALNFASWDGSTWRALASGFNATVRAVCTFDAGSGTELYAGGTFTLGGGVSLKAIGRWNGAAWSPLGSGISTGPNPPSVYAMTVFDDGVAPALYVGGDFSGAGGAVWARRVARWDGSNWSALGLGMNDVVYALTVFDDGGGNALWAGGAFEMINTTYCRFVAKWDGATWTAPYDLGVGEPAASVFALATFDDGSGPALYAGGRFGNAANASGGFFPASNIARWDGSNWFALSSGVDGPVHSLAVFDDGSGPALFVGGTFAHAGGSPALDIAKWTSAGWSAVGSGLNGAVESMHSFDDGSGAALYTGGSFTAAGAVAANRIAKWNGTNWSALGSGTDATVFALTDYDDSSGAALFVGGAFVNASSSGDSFLAKWGCPFVRTGTSYCTSSTTSGGCVPVMSAAGHASTSSSSTFTISVSNLDGQRSGLLFYGIHGQLASPWGAGGTSLLCVKSPTQRMTLHNTSGTAGACDGSLSEDWNAYISSHSSALGSPFTRGDLVWCQAWFRDPPSPKTSALSNGLVFSVGP
jgi:hypothetical protein